MLLTFPFWGFRSAIVIPIVWGLFEGIHKLQFRKEIPCPYCGFDATWYKRDVKMARKAVKEFWAEEAIQPVHVEDSPQDLPVG